MDRAALISNHIFGYCDAIAGRPSRKVLAGNVRVEFMGIPYTYLVCLGRKSESKRNILF